MTDTPQNVEILVEANATEATRAAAAVAKELATVVGKVSELEAKLKGIFGGQLPAELERAKGYLKTLQQAAQVSKTLATGGPDVQLRNAAFRGEIAKLQADQVGQSLRMEREINKLLKDRETIYKRSQANLPINASEKSGVAQYRAALKLQGAGPAAGENKAWYEQTLNQYRFFQQRETAVLETELAKRNALQKTAIAQQQINEEKAAARRALIDANEERRRADAMARQNARAQSNLLAQEQRETQADEKRRKRVEDLNLQARIQLAKDQVTDQASAAKAAAAEEAARAKAAAKAAKPTTTREQSIGSTLQNIRDRYSYQGGAGMFTVQADILRNYATMGAVLGTIGYAARSTVEFQTAMKDVQAIAGSTDTELKALTKTVFEVGSTTKFSTKEIAEGAKILAQAGYSVQQIQEMIKPISDLATGSGSSFSDAANTTTSVLSVFDLSVSRTGEVVNTLTAGLNQSKLSMEQLSLGIQYAGNIAADGGVQFDELVAALGAMANAGIKSGSTLGTGLRALVQDLQNPTKKFVETLQKVGLTTEDVDIKTHGLAQVMETLKTAGFGGAEAFNSFEVRAAAAYTALSNNLNVFESLQQNITGTTAAADAAGTQMETFTAQWQRLLNAVTEFSYVAGSPLLSTLQALVGLLADLVSSASSAAPLFQFLGTVMGALVTAISLRWLLGLVAGFLNLSTVVDLTGIKLVLAAVRAGSFTVALDILTVGLKATTAAMLASPLFWFTAGITALSLVVGAASARQASLNAEIDKYATAANEAKAQSDEYASRVREIDKYVEMLTQRHEALAKNVNLAGAEAERAQAQFGQWGLQLGANANNIDTLITKMIALRGEMAKVSAAQAIVQRDELTNQRTTTEKGLTESFQKAKSTAGAGYGAGALQSSGANAIFSQINQAGATPSSQEVLNWRAQLAQAKSRITGNDPYSKGARDRIDRVLKTLEPVASYSSKVQQLNGQIDQTTSTITDQSIAGSTTTNGFQNSVQGMRQNWSQMLLESNQIKDPKARLDRQLEIQKQMRAEFSALQARKAEDAARVSQDPNVLPGLQARATRNGTTVQQEAMSYYDQNTPGLSSMKVAVGQVDANSTPEALAAHKRALQAQQALAKKVGNRQLYSSLGEQIKKVSQDEALAKWMKEGGDPTTAASIMDSIGQEQDAKTQAGLIPGRGGATRQANNSVKALERQIEQTVGQAGPDAAGIQAARPQLEALLSQWKAAKRRANPDASLEDFNTQTQEYIDKILSGNLEAAKEALAKAAAEAASNKTQDVSIQVRDGTMSLDEALQEITTSFNDAATKAVAAQNEKFRSQYGKNFDPQLSNEAIETNKKIVRGIVQDSLDAANKVLDAAAQRQARELDATALARGDQRAQIAALSNFSGSRNLSDVHRYLGDLEKQKLDVADQRDVVSKAQGDYDRKLTEVGAYQTALQSDPTNADLKDKLAKAQDEAATLNRTLAEAKQNLRAMTDEALPFQTVTEAITAAWKAYADQTMLAKPVMEQLAGGITGVFETARGSFKTLVSDVLSGSKSMGGAIKDFALSVLQSMLDLAAQMLANAAIKWMISTVISAFGGAPNVSSVSANAPVLVAQGGEIPKRYAGGGPAPFRDSVHALLQPGEVVMRRSAVDFIGKDNLLQMNNMGNRRISQMPTLMQNKREPDNVNVWVVAPETKPTLGKNDVLTVVSQDILTGGQMKKLIKAVQVGAA